MDASTAHKIQMLAVTALPIILAITFHEAAHGYVADRKGDPTARLMGRLTLNPLAHVDPWGTIVLPALLFLFTGFVFGYAKPVPVNFMNLRRPKADMVLVAAAGPMMNLALAVGFGALLKVLTAVSGPAQGMGLPGATAGPAGSFEVLQPISQMLVYGVLINIWLMVFNLLPIPPLDGGRVLVGLLPHPASDRVASVEPYGFFILLALLFLDPTHLIQRVLTGISSMLVYLILS
ncbi:MAG TPA: site-2 protease family protein [Nitrospiria bacterium]|nr:site-2 protease family protein [Nitrospiria bacterium]